MRVLLVTVFMVALAFPAWAQEDQFDCANPQFQQEMNYCAALEFEATDRALNVAWGVVKAEIEQREADLPEDMQGWTKALLEAQRAWITYRDAHCRSEGFQFHGGSMEPLIVATCKTHETQQRTQELLLLIETY